MKALMSPNGRLAQLRKAFDRLAESYERRYKDNLFQQLMKERARRRLLERLPPRSFVCDVGCGPGLDACILAARGHRVLGIDIASHMVTQARRRLSPWIRSGRARVITTAFEDAARRLPGLKRRCHAIWAFSMTSGSSLEPFARFCEFFLKPGGWVVFTSVNRMSLWEILIGLLKGDPAFAFRRLRSQGVLLRLEGCPVRAYALSLSSALAPFLRRRYEIVGMESLGCILPPPWLWRPRLNVIRAVWRILSWVEDSIGHWGPLVSYSDQILLTMKKPT